MRKIVKNDLCGNSVSKLGLGIMRHDPNNFENTQKIVDYAMHNGINYFESCYFYLNYQCEKILAKSLSKYPREKYFLCGKMPVHCTLEENDVTPEKIFNEQLKNCNTEYFDYYLIQAVDKRAFKIIDKVNLIEFLNKKKEQGYIKHLGFSFHDLPDVLESFIQKNNWDFVQLQLNYYDWYISTGKQNYEICKKYDIPIVVMGGVKGGTLTHGLPKEAIQYLNIQNPTLQPIDYAYKFLTTLSNVKVILHGSPIIEDLQKNVSFFNKESNFGLFEKELNDIKKVIEMYKNANYINCHECGYCLEVCPRHIKISDIFSLYNKIMNKSDDMNLIKKYVSIQKGDNSSFNCMYCGKCEKKCPQHLNIRDLFHKKIFQLRM